MEINHLVGMANRIGDFFQSMPNREEAKDGVATQQLHDIVREAVKANLAMLATKKVTPRN